MHEGIQEYPEYKSCFVAELKCMYYEAVDAVSATERYSSTKSSFLFLRESLIRAVSRIRRIAIGAFIRSVTAPVNSGGDVSICAS